MVKHDSPTFFPILSIATFFLYLLLFPLCSFAQNNNEIINTATMEDTVKTDTSHIADTLETLSAFVKIRTELLQDITAINKQIDKEKSETAKQELKNQLEKLQIELQSTTHNMNNLAASVDITHLEGNKDNEFDFQKEVFALLKPALEEMKAMTSHVRKKSALRERIAFYEERLPMVEEALSNIQELQEQSKDKTVKNALAASEKLWQKKHTFMTSELQASRLQLEELEASETSITEASQSYIKSFFRKRGLYLTQAILVIVSILLVSRFSYAFMLRYLSGFKKKHRSFRIRLIELIHRLITILLVIIGPMIVFYLAEDWVLFSLGILLIIGIALTLRRTIPMYWHQAQLFLNVGPVREGERIFYEGLPWVIQRINFYSILSNPTADIIQRLPISALVDMQSRPCQPNEPWFPCKKGDWVILNDGVRGKVIGISLEMIQLVQRGGAMVTYQTSDFLSHSPQNLATNFRIKELLGISYSLQSQSTKDIPEKLKAYIQQRLDQEGYGDKLVNLNVEFAQAGSSSLDLVIIADFKGELGDLYNRLRRAIQRWSVDACTEYHWEIPFPQMTLHGALSQSEH